MMLELQGTGCHNINLVSPSHVSAQAVQAISIAADRGLQIPIVYNTGGYDSLETLRSLDGIVDIYMPDMKYDSAKIALELSGIEDYPQINQAALLEMHRQVGDLVINPRGIAERGLLIRHLVLPEGLAGSEGILIFIAEMLSKNTYLNIMDQYHPAYKANTCRELTRRITSNEFTSVLKKAAELGLTRLDKRYF